MKTARASKGSIRFTLKRAAGAMPWLIVREVVRPSGSVLRIVSRHWSQAAAEAARRALTVRAATRRAQRTLRSAPP